MREEKCKCSILLWYVGVGTGARAPVANQKNLVTKEIKKPKHKKDVISDKGQKPGAIKTDTSTR